MAVSLTKTAKSRTLSVGDDFLLKESGDYILKEDGDKIILEQDDLAAYGKASNASVTSYSKS